MIQPVVISVNWLWLWCWFVSSWLLCTDASHGTCAHSVSWCARFNSSLTFNSYKYNQVMCTFPYFFHTKSYKHRADQCECQSVVIGKMTKLLRVILDMSREEGWKREGESEGVLGGGSETDKERERVWLPRRRSPETFMSAWRPGIHCVVQKRPFRAVGVVFRESPVAVMGFRAVLLSFLLVSLSCSRGAVITGVSGTFPATCC